MPITKKKPKTIKLTLQIATRCAALPSALELQDWVDHALIGRTTFTELTIRLIGYRESAQLNETFRNKMGPTNILSFVFEPPPGISSPLLGDLAICAPLVHREAKQQGKTNTAHWAHLVIHGCLHLIGYDHQTAADASKMETLEIKLLEELGYENPY
jgi:probable rRNA maturation factor